MLPSANTAMGNAAEGQKKALDSQYRFGDRAQRWEVKSQS